MKCPNCGASVLVFWQCPGWRIVASADEDGSELQPWPSSLPGIGHWWCAACDTAGLLEQEANT